MVKHDEYFTKKFREEGGLKRLVFCCNECGKDYSSPLTAVRHYRLKHKINLMSESSKEIKELIEERCLKPWKDPESLFCDTEFLNNLGLNVRNGDDCESST